MYKFALILLLFSFLRGQIVIHKTLTVEDGLVQSNITAIHQDRQGFIWFATMDGVSRWDGINFVNFQTHNGLSAAQVYDIYEDAQGDIYFPTYGGGLCRYRHETGKMERVFPQLCQADSDLAVMCRDEAGNFWFGGYKGISRLTPQGTAELVDSSHAVWALAKGKNNTLYFGTYVTGIKMLRNGIWNIFSQKHGLINNAVWRILEADDGSVFVGTNGGVSVLRKNRFYFLGKDEPALASRTIALFQDHKGAMYFGTMKGVVYKNGNTVRRFTEANGLTANDVWSIYEDRDGTMYFGTGGAGVCLYKPGFIENYDKSCGLIDNIVQSIYQDNAGNFWFGTDAGVTVLRPDGTMRHLTVKEGLSGNRVRKIIGDGNGTVYIATRSGLNIWRHGRLTYLTAKQGLIDNQILSLYRARDGALYVCTRKGVSRLQNGRLTNYDKEHGLVDDYVTCAAEDQNGNIYFGTYLGVAVLTKTGWDTLSRADGLAENKILAIHQDRRGYLYFGTYGGGLNILRNGQMQTLSMADGLSSNTVWSIQEDDRGAVYLATGRGLNVLTWHKDSIALRYITHKDGLASDEHNRDASFKDRQGRLWFGTAKGVSCYNPGADQKREQPPNVHLLSVKLFDRPLRASRPVLSYDQNFIDFEFIGIDLRAPEKVTYRYRLAGLEKEWRSGTERHAHYTNLSSGQYVFEVMAANEWGAWSAPRRYAFTIRPPWWKTWWFTLLAAFVLGLGLWQLYLIRVRHLLQMERMRSKIASDLHDDVGSMLTRIYQGSEIVRITKDQEKIKKTAQRIGDLTRQAAQTFSDIVWSIEAQNDTVGNLIDRMRDLPGRILGENEMILDFSVSGLNREKAIAGDVRQHIYLIYKEALHNIAKYAQARRVHIELRNSKQRFEMIIRDDGRGFPKEAWHSGHGFLSMRRRARQLGGTLEITQNGGTTVRLTMPGI